MLNLLKRSWHNNYASAKSEDSDHGSTFSEKDIKLLHLIAGFLGDYHVSSKNSVPKVN